MTVVPTEIGESRSRVGLVNKSVNANLTRCTLYIYGYLLEPHVPHYYPLEAWVFLDYHAVVAVVERSDIPRAW